MLYKWIITLNGYGGKKGTDKTALEQIHRGSSGNFDIFTTSVRHPQTTINLFGSNLLINATVNVFLLASGY